MKDKEYNFNSVNFYVDLVTKAFYNTYLKSKSVEFEINTVSFNIFDGYVEVSGGYSNKNINDEWHKYSVMIYTDKSDEFNIGRVSNYFEEH